MNDQDLLSYSRQIMLPEVGIEGQQGLLDATVLLIGVGGPNQVLNIYSSVKSVCTDETSTSLATIHHSVCSYNLTIQR